ncbi:FAD-dependent oxidoreductase [Viridibacillus sp. YIM B01967]|uniref:FAD-dependent oxidoreductase n=1 Tax=Viridibacillus soli TaxID=2798301 RepID=A0ABS1H5H1_9BACL|nr:FAD-dependent oxidoreductase [Viridibacillus soli]MBK3494660.1 FAD-dependent oxidoreductase [Viridibacillus soli]
MKYVIIGGDAAGMSAAMEIVRRDESAEITTLDKGYIYSYGQCALPYVIDGRIPSTDDVIARSVETFRTKYGIDAKTGHKVTRVDSNAKTVSGVVIETGADFEIAYDRLLVATGANPILPDFEGSGLAGIHTLKTIPDTKAILNALDNSVEQVTIIGGGSIGLDMAESFVTLGKKVRIIQLGNQLAEIFDEDMAELIHEEARQNGIELIFGEEVKGFKGEGVVQTVVTDQGEHATDFVLAAIGVRPNTKFLEGTGIHTMQNGAILVNPYMETSLEDIYAAGDCTSHFHRVKQKNDYMPLGTTANKQGRIAGVNMADGAETFKGIVGTSIVKFFHLTLGRTGLSEREASELGLDYEVHKQKATDIAGYYPGKQEMQLKFIYEKTTQQLYGAQIIGRNGVDKRIDVVATALYHKMILHDLLDLDLAYAPPYNGVWDPIQQLAKQKS